MTTVDAETQTKLNFDMCQQLDSKIQLHGSLCILTSQYYYELKNPSQLYIAVTYSINFSLAARDPLAYLTVTTAQTKNAPTVPSTLKIKIINLRTRCYVKQTRVNGYKPEAAKIFFLYDYMQLYLLLTYNNIC